jgi:hypothetical protein
MRMLAATCIFLEDEDLKSPAERESGNGTPAGKRALQPHVDHELDNHTGSAPSKHEGVGSVRVHLNEKLSVHVVQG